MELTQQQQNMFRSLQQDVEYHVRLANETQAKLQLLLQALGLQAVNVVLTGLEVSVPPSAPQAPLA